MRLLVYWVFLLSTLTLEAGSSYGQTPLRRVYALEKPDGTVLIVAENHHSMPFTILLKAELVKMHSSVTLPCRINVTPGEKTYLLATFTPEATTGYSWHYTYKFQDGIYTGHAPDTSYVYRLPYQLPNDTLRPRHGIGPGWQMRPSIYHMYSWQLPYRTPIVAARAGTIVAVKQAAHNSRIVNDNLVWVLHDDGGYACYENIGPNTVVGQPGRRVVPGDTLAYFTQNKRSPRFWFMVQCATDSVTTSVPVVFRQGQQLVRLR